MRRVFIEIQDNADGVNEQYRIIAKDSGGNEIGSPIVYRKQDESGKVLTFSSNVSRLEAWHDGSRGDFAIFRLALPSHRLSLGLAGDGTVTSDVGGIDCGAASSDCEREFADLDPATVVTLTATPDTGQSFIGWTGCDSTAGTKCTVTMDKALHVHAEFTGFSFGYLAVEVQGSGSVKSSPGGINVGLGATSYETSFAIPNSVRLKASPKAGWRFLHWEGGRCSGSNPTCVLSVDDCFDVKAVFGKGDVKITSASTKPVQPKLTRRVPLKFKATGAGTAKVVLYRCSGSRCSRALLRRTIFANAGSNTLTVASRALPPGGYRLAVGNSAGASVTHFDVVAPRASFTG